MKSSRPTPLVLLLLLCSCSAFTAVFGEREGAPLAQSEPSPRAFADALQVQGMGHIPAWLRPTSADIQLANGLLDAVGMLKEGQSGQAAMRLRQLRAENSFGNEVSALHSWALLQAGQTQAAETVARDGIVEFGATPALAFAMAQVFEQENNCAEAFPLYRDLSTLANKDILVLAACARTAVACGRGADALFYLDRLMLIEPLSMEQKRLRGQALELADRPEDALSLYEQMSAENPEDFALLDDMASASFATAQRSGEISHYENAVSLLERLTAVAPQHSEAFFMLATARQELGRDTEAAMAYDRCLETDPGNVEAGLAFATLLAASGDPQASADVLLSLLRQPISGKDVERVQSRLMTLRPRENNR
jgi:tetratricopeptide (TPR) repeat protein